MKYLIVMPRLTQIMEQSYTFPLGIAYVSASLKGSGKDVITLNLNYKQEPTYDILSKVINENSIDVIATGGLTAQYHQLKEILDKAKKIKPGIITWVGGGIITSDPISAMEALESADYGMIGEGEITICELADAMEGTKEISQVKGLIYKQNNKWLMTQKREEIEDLDVLLYPDYEGFEFGKLMEKLPTDIYAFGKGKFGYVSFGRSCPFNCTFCFHPSGTKYRRRSIKSVFDEIDYLIKTFGIENIAVTDELFVKNEEDLHEFCKQISKRNLGFAISLRVDMVNRKMLSLLKENGCLQVGFGLESADNKILKSMKKGITVEQIEYALRLCNEIGLKCMGNFIFGDQEETTETAENTINWWNKHPEFLIALHMIVIYPGSELYKIACERGIIKDKVKFIKEGCPYKNISKMSDSEYRNLAVKIGMLSQPSTDYLTEVKINYISFGKVELNACCPKCGAMNRWGGLDVFRTLTNISCGECGKIMNISVADFIGNIAEIRFKNLLDKKIGIWPMMSCVSRMIEVIPSIRNENVFFIDSSDMKVGIMYEGKEIHSPSIIAEENIEIVFITLTTSVATEIIGEIREKYPQVKKICIAGELIDPNWIL